MGLLSNYNLMKPHRLAHFLAQIAHESDRFHTLTEYGSGSNYEGRVDLGNVYPGDGRRYKGRGPIQLTGRYNYRAFSAWAKARYPKAPDFEKEPNKAAVYPWALMSSVWYWDSRKLNKYADDNNIELITRRINGGLNGYGDRVELYTRTALTLLGYKMEPGVIAKFQKENGLPVDDIAGPKTRAMLHKKLQELPEIVIGKPPAWTNVPGTTIWSTLFNRIKILIGK
jgi:putative chitinase